MCALLLNELYIYPDILLICCDIIFSCVVSGWVLPAGFFTRAGVGQNIYPHAGAGVGGG
jgi:hypothetical protein